MPAEPMPSREGLSPSSPSATVPLFPLGPWLWSSLAVMCWLLLAVTGAGLVFFFQPSPDGAQASLIELREASGFDFLRSLHYWASHGLIIAAWIHLMRVFVVGSYRRVLGWSITLLLVLIAIAQAWTGSLLPIGGGRFGDSFLTLYVGHILFLPALTLILLRVWQSRRAPRPSLRNTVPAETGVSTEARVSEETGVSAKTPISVEDGSTSDTPSAEGTP